MIDRLEFFPPSMDRARYLTHLLKDPLLALNPPDADQFRYSFWNIVTIPLARMISFDTSGR